MTDICNVNHCKQKRKTMEMLEKHRYDKHGIKNGNIYCDVKGCTFNCTTMKGG
jgi:hypothetical protein